MKTVEAAKEKFLEVFRYLKVKKVDFEIDLINPSVSSTSSNKFYCCLVGTVGLYQYLIKDESNITKDYLYQCCFFQNYADYLGITYDLAWAISDGAMDSYEKNPVDLVKQTKDYIRFYNLGLDLVSEFNKMFPDKQI